MLKMLRWAGAVAVGLNLVACASSPMGNQANGRPIFQLAALEQVLSLDPVSVEGEVAKFEGVGPLGAAGGTMAMDLPLPEASGYRLAQQGLSGIRITLTGPNFIVPFVIEIRVPPGCRICSITISGLPPGACNVSIQSIGPSPQPLAQAQVTISVGVTSPVQAQPVNPSRQPTPRPTQVPTPQPTPFQPPLPPAPPAPTAGGGGGGGGGGSAPAPTPTPTPPGDVEVELAVEEAPATPTPLAPDPAFPELPATGSSI